MVGLRQPLQVLLARNGIANQLTLQMVAPSWQGAFAVQVKHHCVGRELVFADLQQGKDVAPAIGDRDQLINQEAALQFLQVS